MRIKKLSLVIVLIALFSCNDDNVVVNEPKIPEEKLNFNLVTDNRNNIQVEEHIALKVENITDSNPSEDIVYKLRPVGNDATKHQQLNNDFALQIRSKHYDSSSSGSKTTKYVYKDIDLFTIARGEKTPSLYIMPKKAGTYKLSFTLQKYNTKTEEYVGDAVTKEFIFNAVKINFAFPTKQTQSPSFWHHSKHRRWWKFSIDDGDRKYDNYLSNTNSATSYTYKTEYDGQTKYDKFAVNTLYDFRDSVEREILPADIADYPQTVDITITQFLKNGTKNIIEYKNVELIY